MALNINKVLLFVSASSLLLALSAQADLAPASAPASVSTSTSETFDFVGLKSLDVVGQATLFIQSNMIAGRNKAEKYLEAMKKRVEDPSTSEANKECLKQCQEVYDSAMDDMKNTIEDMESGDYYKASVDISAVSTNVDTCQECYGDRKRPQDPEAKKFDDWVSGITNDCLDKLDKVIS